MRTHTARTPLRAVIYTRKSNDPSGEGANVATQAKHCRTYAANNGMSVIEPVLTDNDISAYSGKERPGFLRLLQMLAAREADAVIVWHADRLYRQPRDLEPLVDIVEKTKQPIHAVTHSDLDLSTPTGVMLARILAAVNAQYVAHAIENMKARHEANRTQGVNPGGPRPFGYLPVAPHAKGEAPAVQQLDLDEAKLIRTAARDVLTGRSLSAISREWNGAGVTTPFGNPFNITVLRRVLTSARIAGKVEYDGEIIGDAQWPAIIDHPTLIALRAVLHDPERRTVLSDNKIKWLGSGLYRCHCGEKLKIGSSQGGRPRYRCNATGPGHVNRDAADLDQYVTAQLLEHLTEACAVDTTSDAPVSAPDTAPLEAELTRLQGQLTALAAAFTGGERTATAYKTATREIEGQIKAVEQRIAETVEAAHAEPDDLGLAPDWALGPEEAWPDYDIERKRKILAAWVTVTVRPGRRGRPPKDAPRLDTSLIGLDWQR